MIVLNRNTKMPRTKPYTKCPVKLATAGRWPSGWFHGLKPVIGLCIGTRVKIHNSIP